MSRERIFRFRIAEHEYRELGRKAEREGLTKADVLRRALHWPLRGETTPSALKAAAESSTQPGPVETPARPGATALDQLRKRMERT